MHYLGTVKAFTWCALYVYKLFLIGKKSTVLAVTRLTVFKIVIY